ncbi:cold shock domain-containing protein [Acinetobacter wanghuae]|uniref:Cold shock domain-containing protein n=1 Tax=Acinetobacter wanghuae TaxID=2662362 RepID=A0A5Q0P507_9GAMM|nr:cold shock domain-containing protein [Acinetobacter wanghuae]MQW91394.1 cold shock domain-containing protein [Acinetobacter wanghuae]QGA11702.1 cold shock domain-containing protein [Acinetobacter wanghuae]
MKEKDELHQGKVKQYDPAKGFGFIGTIEGDVFFHISDFPADSGEPKRNERVKFAVVENGDKFKAVRIQRVEDTSAKAKKSKISSHNKSITSALLNNLRG